MTRRKTDTPAVAAKNTTMENEESNAIRPIGLPERFTDVDGIWLDPLLNGPVDLGFDQRWIKHPKPEPKTLDAFILKTGWSPKDLEGKTVLDYGCGCGRFSQIALSWGAKHVIGLDGSPAALRAAAINLAEVASKDRYTLVQADLVQAPPFSEGYPPVDVAFSIGVLHHTEDPAKAFSNMVKIARPGGKIAIWVYCKHMSDDAYWPHYHWLHMITSSCPPEILHEACRLYAPAMRNVNLGKWGLLEQIFRASNLLDDEECVSATHDWHCPTYRFWHTVDEVREWFAANECDLDRVGDFPVCVAGTKK